MNQAASKKQYAAASLNDHSGAPKHAVQRVIYQWREVNSLTGCAEFNIVEFLYYTINIILLTL